jgi:hypothetical protein
MLKIFHGHLCKCRENTQIETFLNFSTGSHICKIEHCPFMRGRKARESRRNPEFRISQPPNLAGGGCALTDLVSWTTVLTNQNLLGCCFWGERRSVFCFGFCFV